MVYAANKAPIFIRDAEIENTLRLLINPLIDDAHLNIAHVRTFIIQDSSINAFVSGGQNIFLNTGLLLAADYPEEIMGVVAHELGHIEAGHLAKTQEAADLAKKYGAITAAIGVPLAILSGKPEALAGTLIGSNSVTQRNFLSYTRDMEREADQTALKIFNKGDIGYIFFYKFLKKIQEKELLYASGELDKGYLSTHPLSHERLQTILSHIKEPNAALSFVLPPQYYTLFQRTQGKILAYTKPEQALEFIKNNYLASVKPAIDTHIVQDLMEAVAYMRLNKRKKALKKASYLATNYPDDPFLLEVSADIYAHFNDYDKAIINYKKSLSLVPWSGLIAFNLSRAYDNAIRQKQANINPNIIIDTLNITTKYEPYNVAAWQLKSYWHQQLGNMTLYALSQAEIALLQGDKDKAIFFAKQAQNDASSTKNIRLRASDILLRFE